MSVVINKTKGGINMNRCSIEVSDLLQVLSSDVIVNLVGTTHEGEKNHSFYEGPAEEMPHYLRDGRIKDLMYIAPIPKPLGNGQKILMIMM